MRYYEIIKEGYKEVQQKYVSAGIDPESVEKTINAYKELVNRNQVSGNERNIDWWGKQSFDQFKAFVDEKSSDKSTTQVKRSKIPGKSISLVDNENWHIVIPLDKDASCFHGKNSDWCTAKPNQSYFEEYFYDDEVILIYCLSKKNGGMWAIAAHKDTNEIEMFDQNDKSMEEEEFNSQTGLDVDKIVTEALKHQPNISSSRDVYKEAVSRINNYLKSDEYLGRNTQIEKDLIFTKNGKLCYEYFQKVGNKEDYPLSIQLIAVKESSMAIGYIYNPSEKIKLSAVTNYGNAIMHIKNPSEEIKLAAVTQSGNSIQFIKNPSEELQLAAVMQEGGAIKHIIDKGITPSEEVQLAAVKQSGFAIYYIDNPPEELQLAAVTQNSYNIKYINNPTEKVQLAAVTKNGGEIEYIIRKGIIPSEKVQLAAVTNNGYAIYYIKNPSPSEKVQLAAVRDNRRAINHIDNPTEAVKKAAGL